MRGIWDMIGGMVRLRHDRIDELIGKESGRVNEVAGLADVSPDYLWKLRNDKAPNASAVIVGRLAEVFGVPADYLLGIERDDRGLPVAEADIAVFVARLNHLQPDDRARVRTIFDSILEFGKYSQRSADVGIPDRQKHWPPIFAEMTDVEWQAFEALVDEWARRRRGGLDEAHG